MEEAYLGSVFLFGGNFAPENWAFCAGQTLPIANNEALFRVLHITYGGDGRTNFKLPDMRKQEADLGGMRYITRVKGGIYPRRPD
jgi:microcystin-dependent protein